MKRNGHVRGLAFAASALFMVPMLFASTASADRFTSPNYTIDASSVGSSLSGTQNSSNYKLVSSGGESVIGNAAGGSYKLTQGYVAQLEQSMQLTMQPGGLGFYGSMDEGAGTVVYDGSINTAQGKFTNTPSWVAGKLGGALSFNGTDTAVEVPLSANVSPANSLSLEAWVNPSNVSATTSQKIISITQAGGYGLFLTGTSADVCPAGRICFAFYSGGAYRTVSANKSLLTNGTWTHLAATYDGTTARLFVNGLEQASTSYSGTITYSATAPLCIGAEANNNNCIVDGYFNGIVDEVKVFGRGLTAREVQAEYDAQNAGLSSGLSLNEVAPGVSQTSPFDIAVLTDGPGYTLALSQSQNLTSGGNTIPGVSGSIASPVSWSEGTTKGLGFTLVSTNATALPAKWNSGGAYAALPGVSTGFYTRTDYNAGAKDTLNMRLRLDVATTQPSGNYTNQMVVTGTITP